MKKILLVAFFLFTTLFSSKQTYAFEPFIPYEENPLNVTGQYYNWEEAGIIQASFLYDESKYKMWYTSLGNGMRLAYGESTDNVNWERKKLYNFLNNQDIHDPSILKTPQGYVLYFGTTPPGQHTRIMRIDSSNGIDFDLSTLQTVLMPEQSWEWAGVSSPTIYFENGAYYLFYTALSNNWKMGFAYSTDGIHFTKCHDFLLEADVAPKSLVKKDNIYSLFFHSPNGVETVETTSQPSCNSNWTNRHIVFDSPRFHSVMHKDNALYLYYAKNINSLWSLNRASSSEQVKKNPIIIIPGFLGSWNKDAILHNKIVLQQDWILNPIAKEYEGLEKTLIHLGYEKNKDFYYFNYDWRKDIESNADKLNVFINNLHLEQPADLVGHSLGGIVGRIYAQKYGKTNIEHLVTVGSPHQGIAKSYMAVEGGEIETDNSLFWLAEKIVLQLYKDGLKTDRQILSENFPVIQNLIPTTDFLKDESQVISISNMAIKNNLLSRYQDNFNQIFDILQTTSGEKGMTTSGYVVKKRNVIDELLANYPDGRPIQKLTDMGDLTVTSVSAKGGENPIILSKDHGELIYTKDAIKQLLDTLQIGVEDKDIIEGKRTNLFPSLIFLMLSPAKLEIRVGGKTYQEQEGVVFIENALSNSYELRATGQDNGRYSILVGRLTEEKDYWTRIEGIITANPPSSQTDIYTLLLDDQFPQLSLSSSSTLFEELILYLSDINITFKKADITKAINNLKFSKQLSEVQNKGKLKTTLLLSHQQLFSGYYKLPIQERAKVLYAVEKLERLHDQVMGSYNIGISPSKLKSDIRNLKKLDLPTQTFLLSMKNKGKNILKNTQTLIEINKRLKQAEYSISQNRLNYAQILLKSVNELVKEVRKL